MPVLKKTNHFAKGIGIDYLRSKDQNTPSPVGLKNNNIYGYSLANFLIDSRID